MCRKQPGPIIGRQDRKVAVVVVNILNAPIERMKVSEKSFRDGWEKKKIEGAHE